MMINLFCMLCWTNLIPLEYYPFFDTYSSCSDRAYEQQLELGSGGYDGYVLPCISEALKDELDRVYDKILQNLSLDSKELKNELERDEISISDKHLEQIVAFRKKERKRLEKEQDAWVDCRHKYSNFIYCTFWGGSARLTTPYATNNYWLFRRINELKGRYQSIFNKDIQYKHLWGEWKSPEDTEKLWFERTTTRNVKKRYTHSDSINGISKDGFYELNNGRLILTEEKTNQSDSAWIDIIDHHDSLFLQFYEDPKVEPLDTWLYQHIEEALMHELNRVYKEIIDSRTEISRKIKQENEFEEFTDEIIKYAEEEIDSIKCAQEAWLEWISSSFDDLELMYPDGTVQSLKHSPQRNRETYEWILLLQDDISCGAPIADITTNIFLNEGKTKWICHDRKEVWYLSKNGDELYSYHILNGEELVEQGNFYFEKGDLKFQPTEISKRLLDQPMEMTKSERLLSYKYLFTPLKVSKSLKKNSPF